MNQRYGHFCYNRTTGNINVPKLFQKIYINIAVIDTKWNLLSKNIVTQCLPGFIKYLAPCNLDNKLKRLLWVVVRQHYTNLLNEKKFIVPLD